VDKSPDQEESIKRMAVLGFHPRDVSRDFIFSLDLKHHPPGCVRASLICPTSLKTLQPACASGEIPCSSQKHGNTVAHGGTAIIVQKVLVPMGHDAYLVTRVRSISSYKLPFVSSGRIIKDEKWRR
jgi:hypothetical protein